MADRIAPELPLATEQHLFSVVFPTPTELVIETRDHYTRLLDQAARGEIAFSADTLEWIKGYVKVFQHELNERAANGSL